MHQYTIYRAIRAHYENHIKDQVKNKPEESWGNPAFGYDSKN